MSADAFRPDEGPIMNVREGMQVIDSAEQEVGTVELVKMGDAEAVTPQGQSTRGGLVEGVVQAFRGGEPQVPAQRAAQLLRTGFVKVDGKGVLDRDLYVAPDQVAVVAADVVHLAVTADELLRET